MDKERIQWLRIEHNLSANWYSKECKKCRRKFNVNRVTKPEPDEILEWCFECYKKYILEEN